MLLFSNFTVNQRQKKKGFSVQLFAFLLSICAKIICWKKAKKKEKEKIDKNNLDNDLNNSNNRNDYRLFKQIFSCFPYCIWKTINLVDKSKPIIRYLNGFKKKKSKKNCYFNSTFFVRRQTAFSINLCLNLRCFF